MEEVKRDIEQLKKMRRAVIVAHNYVLPEVQDVADFVGDSLGLSIAASTIKAEVIVFCGVFFMAETAKILSPRKIVLLPEREAGCPMADMITPSELHTLKERHPGATVLAYVNTSAAVKAECDFCCTSANAVKVVREGLSGEEEIIFIPDQYLAHYVAQKTGRSFITWPGYCPVHAQITAEEVERARRLHPQAEILIHPECRPEVVEYATCVLSTEGMCRYVRESQAREFLIGTEIGILHRLRRENPEKEFYPVSEGAVCTNMKKIALEKVRWALETMEYQIELPELVIHRARRSIERMLQFV